MVETPTHKTVNLYPQLDNVMQFILEKINRIKDYFFAEICEREKMRKRISKYSAAFDYYNNIFLVLLVSSGGVSISSFAIVIGAPVGITSTNFCLLFCITNRNF